MSCASKGQIKLVDVSKDTSIIIKTNAKHPIMMLLEIKGQTNDSFKINSHTLPGGHVDTKIQIDWYTKDFPFDYKSYKVTKGNLTIKYNL